MKKMKTKFNFNIGELINSFDKVTSVQFKCGKWGGDRMVLHIDLETGYNNRIPINDIIKKLDELNISIIKSSDIYDDDYGEPYLYTEFECVAK